MIKKNALKRILITTLSIMILVIVYLFPNDVFESYDTVTSYIEPLKMPIYLLDENDYVARINILQNSDDTLENAKYIISTLTVGTTESSYLSVSFKPVIPEGTVVNSISLDNNILKIDFSEEFLNIDSDTEESLIESLVFSLCEFSDVDKIMIFINGDNLQKLPNSNKTIPLVLDKTYGVNKVYDLTSLKDTTQTTTYYLAKSENDDYYYIPISKVENTNLEKIEIIIKNLQTSPINQTNLISYLKASATLEYYEILEESVLLSFNNELIADLSDESILEEVQYSIYLSLRDTYDISQVIFEDSNSISVSVFN